MFWGLAMKQFFIRKYMQNNNNNLLIINSNNQGINHCDLNTQANTHWFNGFYTKVLFALVFMFALAMQTAMAADAAATVFFKSGNVTAQSSQHGLRHLEKDDSIFSTDEIDTADNGRAQLRFTDGGLVSLMPGTIFSVEEYLFDDADEDSSAVFGLLKGGLRTVTGAIGKVKHEDYELKTPVATLGIRGTEFTAVLQNARTLLVHVGRGKVVITNDNGTLELLTGQNAIVVMDGAPELTDVEPLFLATSVNGDDLQTEQTTDQDPYVPDTLRDMPANISFDNVLFHADLNARIVGVDYLYNDYAPVGLFNVNFSKFNTGGGWLQEIEGTNNYLEWGYYWSDGGSNTLGQIDGNDVEIFVYDDAYLPYVYSDQAMVDFMPAGTLSYSLAATGINAYDDKNQGSWLVDTFDLDINLGQLTYGIDFLVKSGTNNYASNTNGSLNQGSKSQNFGFTNAPVSFNGGSCPSCSLEVNGFLAGDNAQAAGVNFKVNTDSNTLPGESQPHGDIYGAVPLKHTSGNTGLGGGNSGGGGNPPPGLVGG